MLVDSTVEILRFGREFDKVGSVVFEQTVAVLSCERYKFKPDATVEDSTDIEFVEAPPPLLLLKQVSINKLDTPSQFKGVDKVKSKFPVPVVGV